MEFRKIRRTAIGQHDATEAAVIGFPHRRVDADLGGDAANEERFDAAILEHQFQIGLIESALARLVDHRFAGGRVELGDDVVPRLAADEDAAHRAQGADAHGRIASLDLHRRGIGQVGPVAFAGMDDENAGAPRGGQDVRARSHRRS